MTDLVSLCFGIFNISVVPHVEITFTILLAFQETAKNVPFYQNLVPYFSSFAFPKFYGKFFLFFLNVPVALIYIKAKSLKSKIVL